MKTLNASRPLPRGDPGFRFASAREIAFSLAEAEADLLEPELIAWIDRSGGGTSPVLEGCGGPNAWRDYGVSHEGRLEVDIDDTAFIFAESSQYDSYAHLGPGPYINIRDSRGTELICLAGGKACVPLDEWTSKLT